MRTFKVATYYNTYDGQLRKRDVSAYALWYNPEWPGFALYEVTAKSGTDAKRQAVELRLAAEIELRNNVVADQERRRRLRKGGILSDDIGCKHGHINCTQCAEAAYVARLAKKLEDIESAYYGWCRGRKLARSSSDALKRIGAVLRGKS